MSKSELDTDIMYLPGVGPKRASLLRSQLEVSTIGDFIRIYPFRYMDRGSITPISEVVPDSAFVQVQAKVIGVSLQPKHLRVTVDDGTGLMDLVFFRYLKHTHGRLTPGASFLFFGKPSLYNNRLNMVHPEIDPPLSDEDRAKGGVLTGVYPSTEKLKNAGITGRVMNKLMLSALRLCLPEVKESLPDYVLRDKGLVPLSTALESIHFPKDVYALRRAERRLKFEELFYLQLSLLKQKYVRSRADRGIRMPKVGVAFNKCYEALPYELTGAQKRVIKEIRADLMSGRQMNRLLQGDVGSGKTMVAVLSALIAIGNGRQACIMAPTEVLSQQHFTNISRYLEPTGVSIRLLTGATRTAARREILAGLADGSLDIVVGTHALLEDKVVFKDLGLAIIDEQHRFGVDQRSRLWSKGSGEAPPHVLIMTATPIPRTLAMTLYGDLDVSVIDEMPPGRKPIQTMVITENRRAALNKFMKEQIALGRQVFVVYPLIFESEKMDYKNLEQGYERMVQDFPFPDYKVAIVHGQQDDDVRDYNMNGFVSGKANILMSTTVIEVGVDVPNASVMVIESAERFGLSQLHQLRGRVGRGSEESYCILVKGDKVSREGAKRLDLVASTEDGFALAEEDMKLRGPGDLEGTQQSGLPIELNIASLAKDGLLLEEARAYATAIIDADPLLEARENSLLAFELRKDKYNVKDYSKIS